jgi:nucleolar complex protein 3
MLCDARSIDMSRLAAFVKRLANAALHAGAGEATGLVAAARFLMARHVTLRAALDNDGAIPGVYKPDALDPAESGAQSTMLWEIALLPHHWHPAVRACALRLTRVVPSRG